MTLYLLPLRPAFMLDSENVHFYKSHKMCAQLFSPSRIFIFVGGLVRGDLCLRTQLLARLQRDWVC